MEPNKEDILARLQKENPHSIPTFKAMEEYANEWKQKYDELSAERERLKYGHELLNDALKNLQVKYDEVKAQHESLEKAAIRQNEKWIEADREHTALKERAEAYEKALKSITEQKNPRNRAEYKSFVGTTVSIAHNALSYNSSTGGIFIGNPAGYCHECGFPVPECNCEPSTNNKNENHG